MKSFFRYPGGKSKFSRTIVSLLKNCQATEYREPFFGGGSIGLEMLPHCNQSWFNDKDVGIYALWQSIKLYPDQLKKKVSEFQPSLEKFDENKSFLLHENKSFLLDENIVKVGFSKLVVHQLSFSGLGVKGGPLGGRNQHDGTKYPIDCRWSPTHLNKKIDELHDHFSKTSVKITNVDYLDLIEDNSCNALMYLDPPYYVQGKQLYQYFFVDEDHRKLANALKNTSHQWVLSYDECDFIRELYDWANIDEITGNYTIRNASEKVEFLIYPKTLSLPKMKEINEFITF